MLGAVDLILAQHMCEQRHHLPPTTPIWTECIQGLTMHASIMSDHLFMLIFINMKTPLVTNDEVRMTSPHRRDCSVRFARQSKILTEQQDLPLVFVML